MGILYVDLKNDLVIVYNVLKKFSYEVYKLDLNQNTFLLENWFYYIIYNTSFI